MKLRVFGYAALFAFSPLISSILGVIYFSFLRGVFTLSCTGQVHESSLCMPGHVLTLGTFMPAVMLLTIPIALVFVVVHVLRALWRNRGEANSGRGRE